MENRVEKGYDWVLGERPRCHPSMRRHDQRFDQRAVRAEISSHVGRKVTTSARD